MSAFFDNRSFILIDENKLIKFCNKKQLIRNKNLKQIRCSNVYELKTT